MAGDLIARASTDVEAMPNEVWDALVDPKAIKQYMFGTDVRSTWQEGSSIVWSGEWQGNAYEDKGAILEFKPGRRIRYSHFSPLSGLPDVPENYHTVTVELTSIGELTHISLTQDNNSNEEERGHSEENWAMMLAALKHYLEG
jgi:uncharacterized protein YndB with AHSA1/START domain